MATYDDDDEDVLEVSETDFMRELRSIRFDQGESDFSILTQDNLHQVLRNLRTGVSRGMIQSFWKMLAFRSGAPEAETLAADAVYSAVDSAVHGDYGGLGFSIAIGGVVSDFQTSVEGKKLRHQQSVRGVRESAAAQREIEKKRNEELRQKREAEARARAEREERERARLEEEALLEAQRREEAARLEQEQKEEEARQEERRKNEEEKRRLRIRAARDRAASIDPTTPHSPRMDEATPTAGGVTPSRQRRSSITRTREDQIVTSVGPIRSGSERSAAATGRPGGGYSKRMSNNLHTAPVHVDPSNIPSFEEAENEQPRKGTYDKNQLPAGLTRSSTPPLSDHVVLAYQHQHQSSSHAHDETPNRSQQQPNGIASTVNQRHHRRNSSRRTTTSTRQVNTGAAAAGTRDVDAKSDITSISNAGENLALNPAQMQTLHRVHAGLEYLQQMERDRWRQQNMLIDALRDTESWKEISASVVEGKLNALKKDLSEMFEAQSLASAHRVSADLTRELRNVVFGLNVLGEKIAQNTPEQQILNNLLEKVTAWNQMLEERWAVLNVNKYSRERLSESHEEFRGEVLSSLDWVMNKSRETRRVITDQLSADVGNKVSQLLDAFKLTKDGLVRFESGVVDDNQPVVPVSHVTELIANHQAQHSEEAAVLNQRIVELEASVDEYEKREKGWNGEFKNLRGENKDLVMETERLRARISMLEAELEAKDAIEKAKKKATLSERQQEVQDELDQREEALLEGESALHREQQIFDERFEMWDSNRGTFETMVQNHLENAKELTKNASEFNEAIQDECDVALSNWATNHKLLQRSSRSTEARLREQEEMLRREFELTLQRKLKQQYEKLRRAGRVVEGNDMPAGDEKTATDEGLAVETDENGRVLSFKKEKKRHEAQIRELREKAKNWQRKALEVEEQLLEAKDKIIHLQAGIDVRNNVTPDMLKANVDLNVLIEQKKRLIKRLQTIYRTHLKHREQFDLDSLYKSRRAAELDKLRGEEEQNRRLLEDADKEMRRGLRFLDDPSELTNSRHVGVAGLLQLIHVDKYDMRNVCLMGARFLIGIFTQLYASGYRQIDPKMLFNAYRVVTVTFDSFQAQKNNSMDEAVVTFGREAIEQYKWWRAWTHDWQKQTAFSQTFIRHLCNARRNPSRADDGFEPQHLEFNGQPEVSFYRTPGMFFENRIIGSANQSRFYTGRSKSRNRESSRDRDSRDRGGDSRESNASRASSTASTPATTPGTSAPSTPGNSRVRGSSNQRPERATTSG